MRIKSGLFALALTAFGAAPLVAQITTRQDPRDRRPTSTGTGGTIGDIIFGDGSTTTDDRCDVVNARTPDGRIVQVCDDRRRRGGDDPAFEHRRDGRGRRGHVNDRDGDGDFDARDREIRKREHDLAKAEKRRAKALNKGR